MLFSDKPERYSFCFRLLHWLIGLVFLFQFYLVYWKRYVLPKNSPEAKYYIVGLHKPIGAILAPLVLVWLIIRLCSIKPKYPYTIPLWERAAAHLVHTGLYVCLLIMPISGVFMSIAAGYGVDVFGWFQIPMFLTKDTLLSKEIHNIHEYCSYALIGFLVVHIGAALKHRFIDRDNILQRMLPW